MTFTITMVEDEDGMFVVECPAIPGCISQGSTREEAEDNIGDAIRECLAVRREQGLPLTIAARQLEVHVDASAPTAPEAVRALERLGWRVATRRGSHIILTKLGHVATRSVPDHGQIARGTSRALISRAGPTVDEFVTALS